MYIRFVVEKKDTKSGRNMGLFMAMDELHESKSLYIYEQKQEDELYKWFKKHLKVPRVQSSASNHHTKSGAISWFKISASEYINKMRAYGQILEAHDILVKQFTTERPGNIVYEDEHQIAAIPFNDTFK